MRLVLRLSTVKTVRVLLLVLLAMLLPLRDALAGAAHCAGSPNEATRAVAAVHVDTGMHAHDGEHEARLDSMHAGHHDASSGSDESAFGAGDACTLCTASCSAIPIVSAPLSVAAFISLAAVVFPAPVAPAPSHTSEGLERPPRNT